MSCGAHPGGRPAPVLLRTAFHVLARARGAPAFHPRGVWFEGTVTGMSDSDFPLPSGTTAVTGRMSKGAGTARALPDVLRTRPLEFTLLASSPDGGWQDVAHLSVRTATPLRHGISFDPVLNSPSGLEAVPAALRWIRERAYEGSRLGRRADRPSTSTSRDAG